MISQTTGTIEPTLGIPQAKKGLGEALKAYYVLAKARMTFFILLSVAIGFFLADVPNYTSLLLTLIASALLCASCFAINQILEISEDRAMLRTHKRPLPQGLIRSSHAWLFALVNLLLGFSVLYFYVNVLSAIIGLSIVIIYGFIYTPAKKWSSLNTLIGAVPGALPPVLGWVAAKNSIDFIAIILFAFLFFWQLPHFLALAWMYKQDYQRGGFQMLGVSQKENSFCAQQILLHTVFLVGVSILPVIFVSSAEFYLIGALLGGAFFLLKSFSFYRNPSDDTARKVFFASLLYLPWMYLFLLIPLPQIG